MHNIFQTGQETWKSPDQLKQLKCQLFGEVYVIVLKQYKFFISVQSIESSLSEHLPKVIVSTVTMPEKTAAEERLFSHLKEIRTD